MRTIHKYVLDLDLDGTKVATHEGARFIHVANQREQVTVWATLERERVATLHVVGTGHAVPPDATHIGSALFSDGMFVFHVYAENDR